MSTTTAWQIGPIKTPSLYWGGCEHTGTTHQCPHCGLILLTGEKPGFCCGNSGEHLHEMEALPPFLLNTPFSFLTLKYPLYLTYSTSFFLSLFLKPHMNSHMHLGLQSFLSFKAIYITVFDPITKILPFGGFCMMALGMIKSLTHNGPLSYLPHG